ncbi:MAG: VacJ family lipoprotein [Nitrosomonas sp.]|nr:VacJ family lipoprotein [Nitrosomonas sp.]
MTHFLRPRIIIPIIIGFFLTGCASVENRQDPFESMNRAVFEFNEVLDDKVMEPVARGYKAVVPDPIEMVIGNFFSNLNDVVITGNAALQLNFPDALASGTRVLINTTFGMLGMIDIASDFSAVSDIDLSKRNEDFGQTLGRYGVGSGPYLVLPFMGPSSFRDVVGIGVDGYFADPVTSVFLMRHVNHSVHKSLDAVVRVPVATLRAIDARADLLDTEKILEEAALDKYEFIRDAYIQRRNNLVQNSNVADVDYDEGQ